MSQADASAAEALDRALAATERWALALSALALLAVDPVGLGGALVRARPGPVRERWLAALQARLPAGTPVRRMPLHISDERLLGGLDLAATLQAGRPVAQTGLLAQCDGGLIIVAMAERLQAGHAAMLCAAMDRGELQSEREGLSQRSPSRFGVLALDEGETEDEQAPAALGDRLAFKIELETLSWRDADHLPLLPDAPQLLAARARLRDVAFDADTVSALCATTLALGIDSPRAAWQAWRAACASAALRGSRQVEAEDAALAARLVLAPRATQRPAPPAGEESTDAPAESASNSDKDEPTPTPPAPPPEGQPEPPPRDGGAASDADDPQAEPDPSTEAPTPQALHEQLIEAAMAAIPAGLLATLQLGRSGGAAQAGRAAAWSASLRGGRPVGSRRGDPRSGARLSLVDTLRAAAPWQTLRRAQRLARDSHGAAGPSAPNRKAAQIEVQADDFRIRRYEQRRATTTLFIVDASGSAALHRLAEAKGAVNLLLADCYVRRDSVAVLGFRGRSAELLLPPTRSLVRAKRSLAALPGGGGTPMAAAIDAALALADKVRRAGATPLLVFLTDGRANIARDGRSGRALAEEDALRAAASLRAARMASLLIDTSPQPAAAAQRLAAAMAAQYRALPYAGAQALSQAVRGLQQGVQSPLRGGSVPRSPG
jgi:magnesium chelatase subunit D